MSYSFNLNYFLYLMLFIGVISNKIGNFSYILIIIFILVIPFFKKKATNINTFILVLPLFFLLILDLSYLYQIVYYEHKDLYFIQFFGSQIFFFFFLYFFVDIRYFIKTHIKNFLSNSIVIMALIVIIDYIFIINGMTISQLMYRTDLGSNYLTKPLGLFAQFSVNSTYAVVFLMLYFSFLKKIKINFYNIFLFSLTSIVVILQSSGTGYIIYLIMLLTIFYKSIFIRYIIFPIILILVVFLIQSGLVHKISFEYLTYLYEYFYKIVNINYISNLNSVLDFIFGIDGKYNFPIDFGPLFMISKVGFLYFLLYLFVLCYIVYLSNNKFFKVAIFCLVLGNLHYPTLFYPIMNILLPLLTLFIIDETKRYKMN